MAEAIQTYTRHTKDDGTTEFSHEAFFPMPEELSTYPGAPAFSARPNQPIKNFWRWIGAVFRGKTSNALIKKYGADNWYNWALQNWGTKWGIYDATDWEQIAPEDVIDLIDPDYDIPEDLRELETVASIHFDSAWSPATRIIAKLSERYPEAYFGLIYADEGGGFVGADLIAGGDCLATYEPDWDHPDGIEMRIRVGYYWPDEEEDGDDLDSTRVPDEAIEQLIPIVTNSPSLAGGSHE